MGDERALAEWLEAGCTPRERWRVGIEHETFVYRRDDLGPAPFRGEGGISGIFDELEALRWEPRRQAGERIGLARGDAAVSLEPAGQLEFAGAPHDSVHAVCDELRAHLYEVTGAARERGLALLGMGFHPLWGRELPWIPNERFRLMRDTMPRVGRHGLDMMQRTCAMQVSVDFASEADMVRKLRVGLSLQPLASALFACSPFVEGSPCGHVSHRSFVWSETDPSRCGIPAFVFEDGMGFERYAQWALDLPMVSVERDGRHVDARAQSFRAFLEGRHPALPGERPLVRDWTQHLATLMPEARLKRVIELRGADSGTLPWMCALPAFWTGLLYDDDALGSAWDEVRGWSQREREGLWRDAARRGLAAEVRGVSLRELALQVLTWSAEGLRRRARRDGSDRDEAAHLAPLVESLESGRTQADALCAAWRERWDGSVEPAIRAFRYVQPGAEEGAEDAPPERRRRRGPTRRRRWEARPS